MDEVELAPEPAVVALLRLLETLQIGVEVGLRVEGRPVDPGQLGVLLVAAPVGAREARQLDRLDRGRVLEVRAAAEIREVALRVERDLALGGVDELDLVVLALLGEEALRLLGRDLAALPRCGPPSARAGSPPRCARARPRRSAPETRSRSRSRSRSAGRWRSSCPGTAGERPRPGGARRSGAGRRAHRDRPCRASSGSGSARRPQGAPADPGHARSSARGRLPSPASGRSRQPRRAPSRRREVRVPRSRAERPSWKIRICPARTIATRRSPSLRRPIPKRESDPAPKTTLGPTKTR